MTKLHMGKSSWTSGRLIRAEQSGNLDGNQSNQILSITYAPDGDNDSMIGGGSKVPNTANTEAFFTNAPMIIKEYKVTVASNDLCMLHQYYGDENHTPNWNTTDVDFHTGLKQWTMIPGGKQVYASEWQADSLPLNADGVDVTETSHSNMYQVRTLKFDTDYIKGRGKRKGYWKNGLRPIVLSKNKGRKFGFTVSNISGNDNTFFYAVVEIKRWSILE